MKKKSRFIVFILSPVPGLSHLYLGKSQRAFTFFSMFLGLIIASIIGEHILPIGTGIIGGLTFMAIALLWFLALAEGMSIASATHYLNPEGDENANESPQSIVSSRKMIAIGLSIFPGAGHMYLGLLRQGAQLMAAFFLAMALVSFLGLNILAFLLPVIWFYAIFDVCHLLEEESDGLRADDSIIFDWFTDHPQWVGWGLIIVGLLVILQRVISPSLDYFMTPAVKNYIETFLVALLMIGGGIKLLMGSKSDYNEDGEDR